LYPGVEEIIAKCLDNSLLHCGICCESLASQMVFKASKQMEMLGPILPAGLVTCDLFQHNGWQFVDCPAYSGGLMGSDF
jgi:hypothetical protein